MGYSYCGNSGIQLTEISLGLCYNFGFADDYETACEMIIRAFEQEIPIWKTYLSHDRN
ncbi:hypothetical protein [Proteiniphilum sp. UBA5384]|uniref:hypothetical protein n=1 Tax=Proteiniphilum sp. UBA5384 TaxID=1947279 RepID=UPI0025DA8271|nr:hypothetical protein [Proteiniphilum sp. UBA5384]